MQDRENEIILYQPDNSIQLEVRLENATVWLTQAQMCVLFMRDRTVITKHINNLFKEGELELKSNVHFLHIANSDKPVAFYNLDVIISVGYRQNYDFNMIYLITMIINHINHNNHINHSSDNFDNTVYHIGASLKDLGKKLFAFSKMGMRHTDILKNKFNN